LGGGGGLGVGGVVNVDGVVLEPDGPTRDHPGNHDEQKKPPRGSDINLPGIFFHEKIGRERKNLGQKKGHGVMHKSFVQHLVFHENHG
jgi:hypothetical protein